MPIFEPLFFSKLSTEQTAEEQEKHIQATQNILAPIYHGEIVDYAREEHFSVCKSQLLALLDYIVQLNPITLHIFSVYRDNIANNLFPHTTQDNIDITLKTAKTNIEASLLAITNNHAKIDSSILMHYIVDKCFSGAFSNIASVLSHFHRNTFSLFIDTAKKQLLFDLIALYRELYDDTEVLPGNEIHFANGIYNEIAEHFGCPLQEDFLMSKNIDDEDIEAYENYIKAEFTVERLIQKLLTLVPLPPEITINDNTQYDKIKNFFESIEVDINEISNLYADDDNGFLHPKQDFSLYLECIIALALKNQGYIKDVDFQMHDYLLFDNGNVIVRYNSQHQFQRLTDEEIVSLLTQNVQQAQRKNTLIQQLNPAVLHTLFKQETVPSEKNHYLNALLKKHNLPENIIQDLLTFFFEEEQNNSAMHSFHKYLFIQNIFEHFYSLPTFWISQLVTYLSPNELFKYFLIAVETQNTLYINAMYHSMSHSQRTFICTYAANHNKVKVIRTLAELGVNLNDIVVTINGNSLAHIAAVRGNTELLDMLITFNVDLNKRNRKGYLPAHMAAARGKANILEKLYSLHVDYLKDSVDTQGNTVTHLAIWFGHPHLIDMFYHYQLDLNARNLKGATPAHFAVQQGDSPALDKLYRYGANLHAVDHELNTIAHIAALTKNMPLLKKIHTMGVDVNAKNKMWFTPGSFLWFNYSHQILDNRLTLLQECQELGINLNSIRFADDNSLTQAAIMQGDTELLEHLINLGVGLDTPNYHGYLPIHTAAQYERADILERLHSLNNNWLTTLINDGGTIAHVAVKYGHIDIVDMVHRFGIDLNTPDTTLRTVAHIAADKGDITLLQHLKKLGVDVNMPDINGFTPGTYMWRRINNQNIKMKISVLNICKKLSIDLNAIYNLDGSPLVHFIAHLDTASTKYSVTQLLDLLQEGGANLNKKDNKGQTLAHLFAQQGNHDILKYLYDHNIDLNIPDARGNTIAHIAANRYTSSFLGHILNLDINFNVPNNEEMTPAHIAAVNGRVNNLLILYDFFQSDPRTPIDWKNILSLTFKNPQKFSLAHIAAQENSCGFLRLLNAYDICHTEKNQVGHIIKTSILEAKDKLGRTAIFSTINQNNQAAFHTLVQLGINLNVQDKYANTLAHIVCKQKALHLSDKLEWLQLLAEHHVKLNTINAQGKTPADEINSKKAKTAIVQKIDALEAARKIREEIEKNTIESSTQDLSLPETRKRSHQTLLPMYNALPKRQKVDAEDKDELSPPQFTSPCSP